VDLKGSTSKIDEKIMYPVMSTQILATHELDTVPVATPGGVVVTITNNLKIPVDIFDVFNPSTGAQTLPFTYTKLGTLAAGATSSVTTIRDGCQLEAMITGPISELGNLYYYQFPVKFMSGTKRPAGNPPIPPYSIEETDRLANVQSFLFHKFSMANPTSALTKNLNAALKSADVVNAVNTFFTGTQNFKNCTLASWNAVMTWLQQFVSGWQGPYYLYQKAPNPMPSGYVPVLVGTLNILSDANNNSATLRLCSADASGNPVYATPPETTDVVVAGDGTLTDGNPGADVTLSLTPVWMNVVQTTMQKDVPVASYLIGSALSGTIAGYEVVSSQTARQIPGKPADPNKASSFDSVFGKICQSVGLIVGLVMLYDIASKKITEAQAKKEQAREEAKDDADLNSREQEIDNEASSDISGEFNSSSATSVLDTAPQIQDSYAETAQAMQRDVMTQAMDDQAQDVDNAIDAQMEIGITPTQDFENAYTNLESSLSSARSSISSDNFTEAGRTLSTASTEMTTAINKQGSEMAEWESSALSESADALEDAATNSEALDQAQQDYENEMNEETGDSGYDAESPDPEVDPIIGE
jgi:hypothetical protein